MKKIQNWNQAYQELASAYMQVEFVPVFDCLTDQAGQLKKNIQLMDCTSVLLVIRLCQKP